MRNVLLALLTMLFIGVSIMSMVNGFQIGNITILSISQIVSENDNLNNKIEALNTLNTTQYQTVLSTLSETSKKLTTAKTQYLDIASISTEAELKEANQQRTYAMEYLWSQIGNHATSRGVNIKLEVSSTGTTGTKKMSFTVVGSYLATMNFIKALEDDPDLYFKIEDFKMVSASAEMLTSTFVVNDITIKEEAISSNSSDSKENELSLDDDIDENTKQTTTKTNTTSDKSANL